MWQMCFKFLFGGYFINEMMNTLHSIYKSYHLKGEFDVVLSYDSFKIT